MTSAQLVAHIARLQRELAAMRDFQARYLNRRRAQGTRTGIDSIMEGHQETIAQTLDLLEAMKAIKSEIAPFQSGNENSDLAVRQTGIRDQAEETTS